VITNIYKIFFLVILFLYQTSVLSKTTDEKDFNPKYLSNYLSAKISYSNQNNEDSVKYFNSSKSIINKHEGYLKEYVFALVLNGEIQKAINQIKLNKDLASSDFFEADLLLLIGNFKNKKFKKNLELLNNIKRFQNQSRYNYIIYETLYSYNDLFLNKILKINSNKNFGKLTIINNALQFCYLNKPETKSKFINLINSKEGDYSRYLFFYLNYIISNDEIDSAIQISQTIDEIGNNLLISQSKTWIKDSNYNKIKEIFSCQRESDLISEFFFLISNFYLINEDFEKSNFYLNLSNYLNPKFYFNLTHLVENYLENENYNIAKSLLNKFDKKDLVYYWYKLKKIAQIISREQNSQQSLNYIEKKFNNYSDPSLKMLFDMGNIYKKNNEFKKSIKLYSLVLKKLDKSSDSYAEILYRRGGSHERVGDYLNSDKDLIKSLSMKPDDPYVMNYLAYGWLERNYKIDEAVVMLNKAYQKKKNDPYIIDSVGWGHYLIEDYVNAEKFLQKAIELMPKDPIVNDHYGDVLWKLNRKLQAKYYWESAFNSGEANDELKENILIKLLKGF
jgi:Flp pilus assembly protein TadD